MRCGRGACAQALARAIAGDHVSARPLFITEDADRQRSPFLAQAGSALERGRGFGDVWLGWTLWRAAALDRRR